MSFVTTFGERAYRRPLAADEVASYLDLAAKARTAGAMPEEVANTSSSHPRVASLLFQSNRSRPGVAHTAPSQSLRDRVAPLVPRLREHARRGALRIGQERTSERSRALQAELTRMLADPKGRLRPEFRGAVARRSVPSTAPPDANFS